MEPVKSRSELFGADDAAVAAAGLTPGLANALAECLVRYEEAITELAAAG